MLNKAIIHRARAVSRAARRAQRCRLRKATVCTSGSGGARGIRRFSPVKQTPRTALSFPRQSFTKVKTLHRARPRYCWNNTYQWIQRQRQPKRQIGFLFESCRVSVGEKKHCMRKYTWKTRAHKRARTNTHTHTHTHTEGDQRTDGGYKVTIWRCRIMCRITTQKLFTM